MGIYDYSNYKLFVRDWVKARANQGHGEYRRMAQHLRVSSTMISQVFNGEKHLNLETACELSEYLGLDSGEEEFFFLLIEYDRAGSARLREKLKKRIDVAQKGAQQISKRVVKNLELDSEQKAVYYSSWMYTALRNLVALPQKWSEEDLAARLNIPLVQTREVLRFLEGAGLVEIMNGRYQPLAKATHLSADSPLVLKHHQNWRLRGIVKMDERSQNDLFYTGPMSLSASDVEKVRGWILDLLQQINKLVIDSPSETTRCLDFDWFGY